MGARGPAKKPAALRLVEGRGAGRDSGGREVKEGPDFSRGAPERPEWLTPLAADEWDRVVPGLVRHRVLKPEDGATLAAYCEHVAEFQTATRALEDAGSLFIDARQGTIPHPAVAVRRNAGSRVQALAKEFGLTPSSEQDLAGDDGSSNGGEGNPF